MLFSTSGWCVRMAFNFIHIYLTLYSSFFRTQNLYCWSGQCRKNHNFVSVSDERGSSYVSNDWIQRGRSCLEKCPFYYVGSRRTRITQSSMEHLLLKYRSNFFFLKRLLYVFSDKMGLGSL